MVTTQLSSDEILASASALPSAPRIFARINALMARSSASIYEIVDLVKIDPSLGASVLQVANSSLYRRGDEVDSIDQAINRVGLRELHRLVGMAVAQQMAVGGLPAYGVNAERFWENSILGALALAGLAKLAEEDEKMAYTIGLLRSIGMALLQITVRKRDLPELAEAERTPRGREAWERRVFGLTAPEVGARLLARWKFPPEMVEAVMWQYRPGEQPGRSRWAALLYLACMQTEVLAKGLPFEKGAWRATPEVLSRARLSAEDVSELIPTLHEEFVRVRGGLAG